MNKKYSVKSRARGRTTVKRPDNKKRRKKILFLTALAAVIFIAWALGAYRNVLVRFSRLP